MCSSNNGQPPDRTALLQRFRSPKPLIISRASDERLLSPPSLKDVLEATERFAPHYDEWMRETHHPKSIEMLRKFSEQGMIGNRIVEVGCGTGVLTANLMVSICAKTLVGMMIGDRARQMRAPTFVCLDQSEEMLRLAKINIETNMREFIASAMLMGPEIAPDEFSITPTRDGNMISLKLRGSGIADIIFSLGDAKGLGNHELSGGIDTVIIAYVMHWFRGIEEKEAVAKRMFDALSPGGTLVSVEESPLVVRRDLHPEDNDIQELAYLIERATTPLTIPEMQEIFQAVGFENVPGAFQKKGIDEYHDMYGMVYRKP